MTPPVARGGSPEWFNIMSMVAYLRLSFEHHNGKLLPKWLPARFVARPEVAELHMLGEGLRGPSALGNIIKRFEQTPSNGDALRVAALLVLATCLRIARDRG